jgi:hypothetical protein
MVERQRWNSRTLLQGVQFDWEDKPTPRSVRLTGSVAKEGEPVRVGVSGAEIEGVIIEVTVGVLHVRLAKAKMQKAVNRPLAHRQSTALGAERKVAKKR